MALFNPLLRVTAGLEELYRTIEAQRPPPRPLSPHDVYSDDEDDAINFGTFSTVYLARDTYVRSTDSTPHDEPSPHRLVAIKVARKGHQAMIQAEYQRLRKLELHSLTAPANSNLPTPSMTPFPNMFLLAYHAFRLVDGCYCFAMDALIGGPVSVKAYPSPSSNVVGLESTSEAFRINQIRKIAVQIIGTLGVLHRHRLIHADIKPDNILRVAPGKCTKPPAGQLFVPGV
ncbi:hypothetical protein IWQ60_005884 [Tieghemiomyces parasiticus]|uniref:Protein kinase domain-containing protein n=1 Tax=Tieghemiomyces parasiticus TaxID=78921 RepID=A0A9W8ABI0_9FUNG|nr:hypothetical protein IWQ60_005884 [Tieghemiomyces parasiticus]